MPGSRSNGKHKIKEFVLKNNIKTILDIGSGGATYPKLLGKKYKFTAVEIWEPYQVWFNYRDYYKEVIIGDASMIKLPEADCIIFGDVLEHMEKEKALKLLKKCLMVFEHVIVSIPVTEDGSIYPAAIHYNNPNEAHISGWTFKELKDLFPWRVAEVERDIAIFCA